MFVRPLIRLLCYVTDIHRLLYVILFNRGAFIILKFNSYMQVFGLYTTLSAVTYQIRDSQG